MDLVKSEMGLTPAEMIDATEGLTAADIQIGRIGVMQALSPDVVEDKFRPGDIVNRVTNEKIGDKKDPCELIILKLSKYWIEKEGDTFIRSFPGIDANELPWEEGTISRTFVMAYHVLLCKEVADGAVFPYILAFKSSGIKRAKEINSLLLRLRSSGGKSWNKVFNMTTELVKKDDKSWYLPKLTIGRATNNDEVSAATMWATMLNTVKSNLQNNVQVVETLAETDF